MELKTFPAIFQDKVKRFGNRVALREKEFGIWRNISWTEYYEHVKHFCLGLISLGLEKGDRVSVLSENCQQWLYADLAIQSAGAITVGVYPTNPAAQVKYIIGHSESKFVVVEDQEQADKVLEVKEHLPCLQKAIVIDMKGLRYYNDPLLISFEEVENLGKELDIREPQLFEFHLKSCKPQDIAVIIYTSGTTGPPKGAMLSQHNMVNMVSSVLKVMPLTEKDSMVSYLPLCHAAERIFSILIPLMTGCVVNFAESLDTVQQSLIEIGPTLFMGVPRIWEKMHSSIVIKMKDATPLKRLVYHFLIPIGMKVCEKRLAKQPIPIWFLALNKMAHLFLYRGLKGFLGLSKARITISGAAPISPNILKFYHGIGLKIREGYGQTEISGISFIHHFDDVKIGTVGKPVPGVEFYLAEDGEIVQKSESIFQGYFKDSEGTQKIYKDGWLWSGDIGEVDEDGHLRIVDRSKDIIVTAGGKNIAPSEVENSLKFSPYIKEAIVIGEGKKFLSALIQIEYDNVSKWAQDNKIPFTTFKSLAQNPEVYELIRKEVDKTNDQFARVENIRKFTLLEKELDHDDEELTATLKVRRKIVEKKYKNLIDTIYGK
jgi:long-chain acyl-CoA synthetase